MTFYDNNVQIGSPVLVDPVDNFTGVAPLPWTFTTTGAHPITAVYSGDSNYASSLGTLTQNVGVATTTTLTSVSNTIPLYGQQALLTATVSPNTATGTVTFFDGGTILGTGTLSLLGGVPTTTIPSSQLAFGKRTQLRARYDGDSGDVSSLSAAFTPAPVVGSSGESGFGSIQQFSGGSLGTVIASGDLRGNGFKDIVTGNSSGVAVSLGNGDGTFQTAATFSLFGTPLRSQSPT